MPPVMLDAPMSDAPIVTGVTCIMVGAMLEI